jgi:hypothetical protein
MISKQYRTRNAFLCRLCVMAAFWTDEFYGTIYSSVQLLQNSEAIARKVWF